MPSKLAFYLNDYNNWIKAGSTLPYLTEWRLRRARNGVLETEDNNDFYEFVGDRVINLTCALFVMENIISPDQQVIIDRLISNNDTLGRLGYQLQLHRYAQLDDSNTRRTTAWTPRQRWPPPKVFADLFEAFIGAVYEEHGWRATKEWLSTILRPLIEKANEDFLQNVKEVPRYLEKGTYVSYERLSSAIQVKFCGFLECRAHKLRTMAEPALLALPRGTKFVFGPNGEIGTDCNMVEIAIHLVNFWVCKVFKTLYPENCKAHLKGPHLISSITLLVTNAWSLGCLGVMLELGMLFDLEDPDFSIFSKKMEVPKFQTAQEAKRDQILKGKLAQAVYATIGWYYSQDAKAAEVWGIKWLLPLVIRGYDIIVQDSSLKNTLPFAAGSAALHARALQDMGRGPLDPIITTQEELEAHFVAMVLDRNQS